MTDFIATFILQAVHVASIWRNYAEDSAIRSKCNLPQGVGRYVPHIELILPRLRVGDNSMVRVLSGDLRASDYQRAEPLFPRGILVETQRFEHNSFFIHSRPIIEGKLLPFKVGAMNYDALHFF
jgi:hypothetical protein